LSNFSQMAAITFPMFTSAATGFVVAMAFIRAFIVKDGGANLGNFYRDLVRFTTRVLLPVSSVLSLFMIWQGSPQTLDAELMVRPILGGEQAIVPLHNFRGDDWRPTPAECRQSPKLGPLWAGTRTLNMTLCRR
jgi:K+-transporting ATPase A subunit